MLTVVTRMKSSGARATSYHIGGRILTLWGGSLAREPDSISNPVHAWRNTLEFHFLTFLPFFGDDVALVSREVGSKLRDKQLPQYTQEENGLQTGSGLFWICRG